MQVVTTVEALRQARAALKGRVAFVPTMGFLHQGHLELMRQGLAHADHLVVSIFVNPTQFGPGEDLDNYPRDPQGDKEACRNAGCEILFMPESGSVYAPDHSTTVHVADLGDSLCGPRRPEHFDGVSTVVAKLFNMVDPDLAVFGQKDYQQLAIVRRMCRDLNFDIEIIGVPTVREDDGLAMSSRNRYLNQIERRNARALSQALIAAHELFATGLRETAALLDVARARIESEPGLSIDYVECVHADSLQPFAGGRAQDDAVLLAMAVHVGHARLIDNLRLDQPLPESLARSTPCLT